MSTYPVRFGVQTGQQNTTWEALQKFWRSADSWGYDSLWVFDHFYPIFVPDPSGPCMEGWTTLSALSQNTTRARIGHLVNGNTYRNPALTAKMAATLDQISGGRLNLGLGAGWFQGEHRSLGFDFKTVAGRLEALDEACQIIKGMLAGDKVSLSGKHYQVADAMCNPPPVQKKLPLLIGGHGEKVLLKLVAKHADMWNLTNGDPAQMKRLIWVIERHGDTVGRDTDEIEKSVMFGLCYKAPQQRQEMMTQMVGMITQSSPETARDKMMIGDKQECIDKVERYLKAGVTHFIFMHAPPITSEEEIQAFAEEVIPAIRKQ